MTDNAIQTDVLEEVESNEKIAIETAEDERYNAIEAMANQRAEEIAEEVSEVGEKEIEEEPINPIEKLVKVKVDGEEIELPLAEVMKGYQKDASGSKKLEQAAQERQQLDRDKAEFEALKQNYSPPEAEEAEIQPSDDVDFTSKLRDAMDDLSIGSEQEQANAANVIKDLLGRGDNPAIQEEQIVSQATKQATHDVLMEIQYNSAHEKFVGDYQDIVNDETLYRMAFDKFDAAVPQSGTYEEAFKKAGDEVRQWMGGISGKSEVSDKIALKEQLSSEPTGVGTRAQRAPVKEPDTLSDIVLAMKAGRGQPT